MRKWGIGMLNYDAGRGKLQDWIVEDADFDTRYFGKSETVMALGNGYLGLRSTNEEEYARQTRGFFVAGTYNRPAGETVPELPNLPDIVNIGFFVEGRPFSLEHGKHNRYSKRLNLKTGELIRRFHWESPEGKRFSFRFERFVSQSDLHLIGTRVTIRAYDDANVVAESGIDGRVTNSGAAHMGSVNTRICDGGTLGYFAKTTESDIGIAIGSAHKVLHNGCPREYSEIRTSRRGAGICYCMKLFAGDTLTIEKLSIVATTRDKDAGANLEQLAARCRNAATQAGAKGYRALFRESAAAMERYWERAGIQIDTDDGFDRLAVRFAQYHMKAMTPAHDDRMGIGAKGLTGEEYKGHSFWDTEIFLLPFFLLTFPEIAKSLLTYRYRGLAGAREKAAENGYDGAMYPWEAAWISDGETTPLWGEIDAVTGERSKIWCGLLEQHITADVAYAVSTYHAATGDEDFMAEQGYEMIFRTALFWSSRLEWNEANRRFEIRNVIGPDEYQEHVDNNAYTNYMAKFSMDLALESYRHLKKTDPVLLARLDEPLEMEANDRQMEQRSALLYLPQPNGNGVIAQDDTYLDKPEIDLSEFKNQKRVRSILKKYNVGQLGSFQVTKQADVLLLLYLRENCFSRDVLRANYDYYEPRTLHDSSLSLAVHSILASKIGECDAAYRLFRRAAELDLGPDMESSDHGIHAAAMGGIWQCVVYGFAGLQFNGGAVDARPHLPAHWRSVSIPLVYRGHPTVLRLTKDQVTVC